MPTALGALALDFARLAGIDDDHPGHGWMKRTDILKLARLREREAERVAWHQDWGGEQLTIVRAAARARRDVVWHRIFDICPDYGFTRADLRSHGSKGEIPHLDCGIGLRRSRRE